MAYHRKGSNIQYCTNRKMFTATPEEATEDNLIYEVCSTFSYAVYKNAIRYRYTFNYKSISKLC